MKIESVAVDTLHLDEGNARLHDRKNLEALMGSLRQFGQRKPIVVTDDNVVVAGNGTLTAARMMDWTKIDVVRVPEDWTQEKIMAFALADNRTAELATWDSELLALQLLELQEFSVDIGEFGFEEITTPDFEPTDVVPRPDEKDPKFCPKCGHDITNY
jgi:ParB-like chromosome segregation protein Spo0J